jgi:hypothetical protein
MASAVRPVRKALRVLPTSQREAIALAFLNELMHADVSRALSIPMGTTKTHIRSGISKLRVELVALGVAAEHRPARVCAGRYWPCVSTMAGSRAATNSSDSGGWFGYVQKANRSNRSLSEGLLIGAYLLTEALYVGLGRLSRLRPEMVGKCQLCSMNFRMEMWSA